MAKLCHAHDALLIINDRPDFAVLCGADGVHLGQDDMPVSAARRILPPHSLIGKSTHTTDQIEAAPSFGGGMEEAEFITGMGKGRFTPSMGEATLSGALIETDDRTGLAKRIVPVRDGGVLSASGPE